MAAATVAKTKRQKMLSAPLSTPAEKNIGATIRIGREIWCLPYAGFLEPKSIH